MNPRKPPLRQIFTGAVVFLLLLLAFLIFRQRGEKPPETSPTARSSLAPATERPAPGTMLSSDTTPVPAAGMERRPATKGEWLTWLRDKAKLHVDRDGPMPMDADMDACGPIGLEPDVLRATLAQLSQTLNTTAWTEPASAEETEQGMVVRYLPGNTPGHREASRYLRELKENIQRIQGAHYNPALMEAIEEWAHADPLFRYAGDFGQAGLEMTLEDIDTPEGPRFRIRETTMDADWQPVGEERVMVCEKLPWPYSFQLQLKEDVRRREEAGKKMLEQQQQGKSLPPQQ